MPKNSFDLITDWPYHPQMIIALGFIGCFVAAMQDGGPIWAELIVAAIGAPFAALFLFIPYMVSVWVLAVLLSLLQAIRSAVRRSAPATH